jgi:hypothetical protein
MKLLLLAAIIITLASPAFAQRQVEQIIFGSETPVQKPIALPKDVLTKLVEASGDTLKRCMEADGVGARELPKYFAASAININSDNERDVFVQAGERFCFQGAHNTHFWIFGKLGLRLDPGYELLFSIQADFLEILKTSTNGYRDIRSDSHTAVELYSTIWRFDGSKYQARECFVEEFQTKRVVRMRCNDEP